MAVVDDVEPQAVYRDDGGVLVVSLAGRWSVGRAPRLETLASELTERIGSVRQARLDLSGIERLDTLGAYLLGRRLYETMLVWETDPSMRVDEADAAFADVWCAIPKVVFSRTLDSVQGNARLAAGSVAEEARAALEATDKDVGIGGAGLAAAAIGLGLVDELRLFRHPIVVGGGTPFLPPVTEDVPLDLIETRTFGSRVICERYRHARDESD